MLASDPGDQRPEGSGLQRPPLKAAQAPARLPLILQGRWRSREAPQVATSPLRGRQLKWSQDPRAAGRDPSLPQEEGGHSPASRPPCRCGNCTARQSCSANWVFPAELRPASSVMPSRGRPPPRSPSRTGQPRLRRWCCVGKRALCWYRCSAAGRGGQGLPAQRPPPPPHPDCSLKGRQARGTTGWAEGRRPGQGAGCAPDGTQENPSLSDFPILGQQPS